MNATPILILIGIIVYVCWWSSRAVTDTLQSEETTTNYTDAAAVTVTVYYETYCPDCVTFIIKQLYPVHAFLREKLVIDFVPFGKAEEFLVDGEPRFVCQHGARECEGNTLHACVAKQACGERPPQRPQLKVVVQGADYMSTCSQEFLVDGEPRFVCQHGARECEGNTLHACVAKQACGERPPQRPQLKVVVQGADSMSTCSQEFLVDGEPRFICQHGARECEGNTLHACAAKEACGELPPQDCPWDRRSRLMEFVYCDLAHDNHVGLAKECAKMAGLDADEILDCADRSDGLKLLSHYGNRTAAFRPAIGRYTGFVPSVAIDGIPNPEAWKNLLGELYKQRPEYC